MKKSLRKVFAGLLAAGLLAGCSGNGGGTPATSTPSETKEPEQTQVAAPAGDAIEILKNMETLTVPTPKGTKKGNVTMGPDSDKKTMVASGAMTFETLDPFFINGIEGMRIGSVYLDKMWVTAVGEPNEIGILVKEWSIEDDNMTIDWEIYDNIYDFEGNQITAQDLQWFYDKYIETRAMANLTDFHATGEFTGQLTLKNPYYPGFLANATGSIVAISQAEYEKNPDRFRNDPVGTGQYRCIDFKSGATATFMQTYNWWGDPEKLPGHLKANVDVVRYDVILEQQQIQTALETNTIQIYDINASTAEDFINENGSVKVLKYPCSWPVLLTLNSAPGAVFENNPTLRHAIAYAIDYDALALAATKGTGTGMTTFGYEGLVGYNKEWEKPGNHIEYDPEKAAQLLEEAGYKPGELKLRFITNQNSEANLVIQASLAAIGVDFEINVMDEVQYLDARFAAVQNEWDVCGYAMSPNGFLMNGFYTLCDITRLATGAAYGNKDQELHDLMMDALYDQTQEKIDKVYYALQDKMYYIHEYQYNNWVGAYEKIEAGYPETGFKVFPQSCIFADDYDVYYEK